jgi:hypothetical protein
MMAIGRSGQAACAGAAAIAIMAVASAIAPLRHEVPGRPLTIRLPSRTRVADAGAADFHPIEA